MRGKKINNQINKSKRICIILKIFFILSFFDKITRAICVPSSCSPTDVQNMTRKFYNSITTVDPLMYHVKEETPLNFLEWGAM